MKQTRFTLIFSLLIIPLLITGCSDDVVLNAVTVTPSSPSVTKGLTQQFTATGAYSDGSRKDLTSSVIWESNNPAVATIDSTGLATAVEEGEAKITAKEPIESISGSTTLTVTSLQSISVTPENPSLAVGSQQQFTATGNYSDGSTQDLTASVTWSSSDTAIAEIDSAGLATALAEGTTTITATETTSSISGSTTLTVTQP